VSAPHERGRGHPGKRKDIHERALGLLAVRQRSRREIQRRLERAGFGPEEVREELDRLQQVGLIDDEAFSRSVVEHSFATRKEGRRVVAGRLISAGIAPDIAEAALDAVVGGEEERADALAAGKAAKLSGLPPDAAYRRLYGMLARRGYAPDVAGRAARRALAVEAFEE
jgi:regulatory protein